MTHETIRQVVTVCLCIAVVCQATFGASAVFAAEADVDALKDLYARAKITEIWQPVPATVSVNSQGVPSDALVLALDQWRSVKGGAAPWQVDGDYFTVEPGTGDIETVEHYTDV
jgi:hypothetical protein